MNKEQRNFLSSLRNEFKSCYIKLKDRKIVLFGAGSYGIMMIKALNDIGMKKNILAVCDNNPLKWGGELEGIKVVSIESLITDEKDFVIIISSQYESEIRESLEQYPVEIFNKPLYMAGFIEQMMTFYIYKTTSIVNNDMDFYNWIGKHGLDEIELNQLLSLLEDKESKSIIHNRFKFFYTGDVNYIKANRIENLEYFGSEYYFSNITENEIFVDCGAYNGDTIESFINCVNGKYKEIFAFEPDKKNFQLLSEKVETYKNIVLYKYGTGRKKETICFNERGGMGSFISDNGESRIEIIRLDDIITTDVTWIKMDVEGAELDSLVGAERLIKKCKPKLAICIYHKYEDMYRIIQFLHQIEPKYKFVVRQHDASLFDTVLYASV